MNKMQEDLLFGRMYFEKSEEGRQYLLTDVLPEKITGKQLNLSIRRTDNREIIFPIFEQRAYTYGIYSEYMRRHGCACCSLTTLLAAFCPEWSKLHPEETIVRVERECLEETEWKKNYKKHIARQMPVSLYGISLILEKYQVAHRYIGNFKDEEALQNIRKHLFKGKPVVIETSRMKRKNGKIIKFFDKRFAGSYHTMILLGIDKHEQIIFTDSAYREWSGEWQRLKRASLEELMAYMFPQKNQSDTHGYFSRRKNTGGFILVDE